MTPPTDSPELVEDVRCVHAERCPGCPWLGRSYAASLADKTSRVVGALSGFAELAEACVQATGAAPQRAAYRVRAKLVADRNGSIGLYARGTHDVVDLPECQVIDPLVAEVCAVIRSHARTLPVLEGVDVQRVDGESGASAMVTLIVGEDCTEADVAELSRRVLADAPLVRSLAVSHRARRAVQLLGSDLRVLYGPDELAAHSAKDAPYHYATHGAFVQAHPAVARALYANIASTVFARGNDAPQVLELYAGSGALALTLAARGARVTAVEAYAPAAQRMAKAGREQALTLDVRAGDALAEARGLVAQRRAFDAVLVNPPRRGLDKDVRSAVARLAPRQVIYVSCHPATLARDLAHLAREGYAVESIAPFDMMPWTEHVETLAVLTRHAPPAPRVLLETERFIAVDKAPHEPSAPQAEHALSLLERVQKLPGFAEAAPVHRLDVGTSGVCLFARAPAHVAELVRALGGAEQHYLALAHGIVRQQGRIERALGEQGRTLAARTRYVRERVVAGHSLVQVALETSRKHQIRRHFAAIGHAVVGDARYGERRTTLHFNMRHGLDRPFLHCASIALETHGETYRVDSPFAPDLALVLESMQADSGSAPRRERPSEDAQRARSPSTNTLMTERK